jgi:hypothetical protein
MARNPISRPRPKRLRALRLAALALAVGLPFTAARADVGARVLVQVWNPTTPDQQSVKVLTDDPKVVSDALASGWERTRQSVCDRLVAAMGKQRAARGLTLRDIDCRLGGMTLTIARSVAPNVVAATLLLSNAHVAATSTTPTALGSYADPRFSLDVAARLDLTILAEPSPVEPLHVTVAKFTLSGAKLDSQNTPADVIEFFAENLSPFFGGPDYKRLTENAIDAMGSDLTADFNAALAPVNAKLAGPSGDVRIALWGRPQRITIAFAPRLTPPVNGSISGSIAWNAAEYTPRQGCASFVVVAAVQVGPAPLLDPENYTLTGQAPIRRVGEIAMRRVSPLSVCSYTLAKLPAGWPTQLASTLAGGASAASSTTKLVSVKFGLRPDGWDGAVVPNARDRNFAVSREIRITDVPKPAVALPKPSDPMSRLNPGASEAVHRLNEPAVQPNAAPPGSGPSKFAIPHRTLQAAPLKSEKLPSVLEPQR